MDTIQHEQAIEDLTRQIDSLYAKGVTNWTAADARQVTALTKQRALERDAFRMLRDAADLEALPTPRRDRSASSPLRFSLAPNGRRNNRVHSTPPASDGLLQSQLHTSAASPLRKSSAVVQQSFNHLSGDTK